MGYCDFESASAYVEKWMLMMGLFLLVGERRATFTFLKCFVNNLSASNYVLYLFAAVFSNIYFPFSCASLLVLRQKSIMR